MKQFSCCWKYVLCYNEIIVVIEGGGGWGKYVLYGMISLRFCFVHSVCIALI